MGINYCDAMMYWKAKERGIHFDKVLTLGHQTLCLHSSEVTIFRDAYRKASNPRLARRWTTTSGGTTPTDFWAIS
jgi:hypothetical protein